jgi:hypothetical protein
MSLSFGGLGITVCPGWHNSAVFIAWTVENISPSPEQQHPCGCLFLHARPGRQRKELNNFRFAFSQVKTRSERQQEAPGDPGRPPVLSFAVLCVGLQQRA